MTHEPGMGVQVKKYVRIVAFWQCLLVGTVLAQTAPREYQFKIPKESLGMALEAFAQQTGLQIARFTDTQSAQIVVGPVDGRFTADQALTALLTATGLRYEQANDRAIAVMKISDVTNTDKAVSVQKSASQRSPAVVDALTAATSDATDTLVEIVVTGTNIKTADPKTLPITVLDQSAMAARDVSTASQLLDSLPQVPNAPLNETANASFSARGDFAAVNLRGIGTGNTLVLLDGYRLAPHPISSTDENGLPAASVNVNQLPSRGLDHVDVLRDGASSIYGTDAVAGVVNYILDKKFRGVEVGGRVTGNEHGDGKEEEGFVKFGADFAGGAGRVVSTFDYYNRGAIFLRDRSFSADGDHVADAPAPWNTASALIPLSANKFYGLQSTGAYPSFKVGSSTYYIVPQSNGEATVGTTAPVRGVNDGYFFDLNQYQAIQPSTHRVNWTGELEYDLTSSLTAFGDAFIYQADSTLTRQPVAYNSANFTDKPLVVPASSQWNPYGVPVTLLSKYLTDIGPEVDDISDMSYRVIGGFRGSLAGNWTWESALLYNQARVTDIGHNSVRESLFDEAVENGTYNPFGYTFKTVSGQVVIDQPYTNTAAAKASFLSDLRKDGVTSLGNADFRATGTVMDDWAGPIAAAAGAEARHETFKYDEPPYAGLNPAGSGLATDDNDFLLAGPAANWSADRTVISAYGETIIPLASPANELPLLQSLDITASARFEHYSDFGSATKPKVGLNWRPLSWILVRAAYNQGFRAPNLPLLYEGYRKTLQSFTDPITDTTAPHWSILTGNSQLKPEDSTGKSIGIVIDVPQVEGLSVSADYWQIDRRNLVTTDSINDILLSDAALLSKIIAQHPGVPLSQLDFGSGTANYLGDPRVIRSATDNSVYGVLTLPYNAATGFISGVDVSGTYHIPELPIGKVDIQTDWALLTKDYQYATAGAPENNLIDRDGAATWRGNVAVRWTKHQWSAGASAYYIGPFADSNVSLPNGTPAQATQSEALYQSLGRPSYIAKIFSLGRYNYYYVVPHTVTFNSFVGYGFNVDQTTGRAKTNVRLGVVNLTDVKPPLDGGFTGYSTAVYTSLVAGRTWTLDFSHKF